MSGLSQEQIDQFQGTGFLKIGKILDDDYVELLRKEYGAVFDREEYRSLTASKEDMREVKQIMQMCERSLEFRKLVLNEKILVTTRRRTQRIGSVGHLRFTSCRREPGVNMAKGVFSGWGLVVPCCA